MRLDRIEDLLRTRPPDEPAHRSELLLGPRLVPTERPDIRVRRPAVAALATLLGVAVLVALVVAVAGPLAITTDRPSASASATARGSAEESARTVVIPWVDATPAPRPTPEPTPDPRTFPACTANELVLTAAGWGGATGSMAGGASVVNLSSDPCTVAGKPGVELLDKRGAVIATGRGADTGAASPAVVLQAGGVAGVTVVWSNWCGDPPRRPLIVHLSLAAGGDLTATVREDAPGGPGEVPRCDSPGAGSTFGVPIEFAPPEPSSGGYQPEACPVRDLGAFIGDWGAAAGTSYANLVVLNLGSVDCLLPTNPTLELSDAAGRRVLVAQSEPPPASASTLLLPPGWAAIVRVGYADWCAQTPTQPLRADLAMGAERLPVVARSAIPVPPCMSAPATPPPDLFFDGMLSIPGTPSAPEPDPIDTLPVAVTLSALPATAPGGILDYTVTLTNVSEFAKPINLAALCPTYTERLSLPDGGPRVETHLLLNCGPAGVLQPKVPVTFSMRLPIPADAPSGTASLVWLLGTRGSGAKATFEIRA
jgi:uncharacterized protein DUF4232